jgi:outer membrane protein assembly factor BamB
MIRGRAVLSAALVASALGASTAIASSAAARPQARAEAWAGARAAALDSGGSQSWPMYDRDTRRTGMAGGLPAVGRLEVGWRDRLDGAVYGQPLVIGSTVVVATENDTVYALDDATGAVVWRAHVGTPVPRSALPCGDINPLGITGTPVYDGVNGLVYAVAETTGYQHTLFGLSIADGAVLVRRAIPAPDGHPEDDQQRPALTIAHGRVYVAFGGLAGDCGPYRGSVAGVPVSGGGPIITYVVPTAREGAIWGTGGPVLDTGDSMLVADGNGAATSGAYDGSDSVLRLSSLDLHKISLFAPATWAYDNGHDLDLGSTQPVLAAGGAVFEVGKRGVGYLLRDGNLGGVGGAVAQAPICTAFGTAAVNGDKIYEPCSDTGLTAVAVSLASKRIAILWRGPADAHGSAAIGGGAIWVPDSGDGILYALNPATGAVLRSVALGATLPRFSSVALGAGRAYLGTNSGVVAVSGA